MSTISNKIYSRDLLENNTLNRKHHPWGINPMIYLDEIRQQSRIKKYNALQESLSTMSQSSSSSLNKEQREEHLVEIANILDNLKTMRNVVLISKESDIENTTQFGKDIIMITIDLLLRVVKQIGQTNIQTPTLESLIAYIRNLIHKRSAHMRQTIPGLLLISWYELSQLMTFMQNEPELRITIKKVQQLIEIAHDTAIWAYKHLSMEHSIPDQIDFTDRNSIRYTYE